MAKHRSLGKGLGALIPDSTSHYPAPPELPETESNEVYRLPIHMIQPNPSQPRKEMGDEGLEALASSIREHGIVQPLVVRKLQNHSDMYQIVAGERRWRAARIAEVDEIPVRVFRGTDSDAMEVSLVENIQREDLSPLEVADAIRQLIENYSLTQENVSKRLGWSRTAISNKLRLLNLPSNIKNMLNDNVLSEGHARTLLSLSDEQDRIEFARQCTINMWSVRQLEEKIRQFHNRTETIYKNDHEPYLIPSSIKNISRASGFKVRVSGKPDRRKLTLVDLSEDQIDVIMQILESNSDDLFPGK